VFSFAGRKPDKGHRRGPSSKIDLRETHKEKEAKRMHTHADPTKAINEAQPGECARLIFFL
jgi:hypothetical protein